MTERPDSFRMHIPPAYNLYGNRQVWFVEFGWGFFDDVLNGALFALTHLLVMIVGVGLGGGL